MHRRTSAFLSAAFLITFVAACSSSSPQPMAHDSAGSAPAAVKVTPGTAAPADHKLSQIKKGMVDTDVRRIMGEPDSSKNYSTGKAWIPFYYGPDTHRTDYLYSGQGRVVFSRNRYSGNLKVILVTYNPSL